MRLMLKSVVFAAALWVMGPPAGYQKTSFMVPGRGRQ